MTEWFWAEYNLTWYPVHYVLAVTQLLLNYAAVLQIPQKILLQKNKYRKNKCFTCFSLWFQCFAVVVLLLNYHLYRELFLLFSLYPHCYKWGELYYWNTYCMSIMQPQLQPSTTNYIVQNDQPISTKTEHYHLSNRRMYRVSLY